MEYLQKCFYAATGWNEDNIFANTLATSNALLDFKLPTGAKLEVSSQATPHLTSSMTLSNHGSVNGSLAYLYLSVPLRNTMGTKDVSLQDAIAGFRIIEPHLPSKWQHPKTSNSCSLVYGRMYFPGTALEAMVIKRISSSVQLLIKCINNPNLYKSGTMIVYLQENAPRFSREYIYSTNEALFGFRCLYNFGRLKTVVTFPKFDNSVVSLGAELWYAALTMSPGLSTAFRYSTRSTSTGKPLTMTLSCNPILGHVSSTYNVKTSVASTVCSKYDFNWFSYASNLSIGFELYNYSKLRSNIFSATQNRHSSSIHHDMLAPSSDPALLAVSATSNGVAPSHERLKVPQSNTSRHHDLQTHEVMTAFQNMVSESNFSSVVKASTSLSDRMVKLLWVGRYKDFLVSTGVKVDLNSITKIPEVGRFGITFAYAF